MIAADHVEHDVGAASVRRLFGERDKIRGLVVDGDVGADLAAGFAFFGRAGGDDHRGAKGLDKRNCRSADPDEPP